jgi:hypothetical protein
MTSHKVQTQILIISTAVFTLACATLGQFQYTATPIPPTAPPPSPTPVVLTEEDIKEAIQLTLNDFAEAYNQNDVELLVTTLDPDNKPFSRFIKTRFMTDMESYAGAEIHESYVVDYITQREFDLVQAHIIYDENAAVDWLFRELEDGRWVLTEPTVEQTGEMVVQDTEYFVFKTYPWADDVNARVEELMQNARERVNKKLGKVPDENIDVEVIPTYGLYPFDNPNAVAYYSYNGSLSGDGDRMVIYAPNSFLFGWYYLDQGWEAELEDVLTHEYTHMTHARSFDGAGQLADWILEGLAEYVDGINRAYGVAYAIENDAMIPLVDTTPGVVYKQDLAHIYGLEKDTALAYAESESLVAFIVEEKGGFDAFWKLAQAYDDAGGDLDKALKNSLKISQQQFEEQWMDWLKNEYLPAYTK